MATVANFCAAYNQRDMGGLMAAFLENAVVVNEGKVDLFPKREFYKEEFGQAFSEAMNRFPKMGLGEPYVFVVLDTKDRAVIALVSDFGGTQVPSKFSLQNNGGRWSIVKIRYD